MKRRSQSMRNGGGRPRGRICTRTVALVATFALVMSMCPGVAALAFANGQLAGGSAAPEAQDEGETTVTSNTHSMTTGTYRVTGNVTIEPDGSGNGIRVEKDAKVLLVIEEGATLTVIGKNAEKNDVGRAAILLPEGATLTVAGGDALKATGGKAAAGSNGGKARRSATLEEQSYESKQAGVLYAESGNGGKGGNGGGGAGTGIGTDGGPGGAGGTGGKYRKGTATKRLYGVAEVGNTYGYVGEGARRDPPRSQPAP